MIISHSPEFYVGTIMAVTISDAASPHPNKLSRFILVLAVKFSVKYSTKGLSEFASIAEAVDSVHGLS